MLARMSTWRVLRNGDLWLISASREGEIMRTHDVLFQTITNSKQKLSEHESVNAVDGVDERDQLAPLSASLLLQPRTTPKILLVDDDPMYGKILQRLAANHKVSITFCSSLEELGQLDTLDFDVGIIDYNLGAVTGVELTTYLEHTLPTDLPIILISQTRQLVSRRWPDSIRDFVHKAMGPYAVLDAAFEAHEIAQIQKEISKKQGANPMVH